MAGKILGLELEHGDILTVREDPTVRSQANWVQSRVESLSIEEDKEIVAHLLKRSVQDLCVPLRKHRNALDRLVSGEVAVQHNRSTGTAAGLTTADSGDPEAQDSGV